MQCMAVHCRQIRSSVTFSKALQAALLVSRRLKSGGFSSFILKPLVKKPLHQTSNDAVQRRIYTGKP